jgi:hypothetical protein
MLPLVVGVMVDDHTSLCCLSFFDLWILITLLVSSNSSYSKRTVMFTGKEQSCLQ